MLFLIRFFFLGFGLFQFFLPRSICFWFIMFFLGFFSSSYFSKIGFFKQRNWNFLQILGIFPTFRNFDYFFLSLWTFFFRFGDFSIFFYFYASFWIISLPRFLSITKNDHMYQNRYTRALFGNFPPQKCVKPLPSTAAAGRDRPNN